MAEGTLGINKPKMNFAKHHGEVYGDADGARYIQGKNYYDHLGNFLREAPKHAWLPELTAEQEDDRRRQMQANKKFFGSARPRLNDTGVPQTVVNNERENAQARAAERSAA